MNKILISILFLAVSLSAQSYYLDRNKDAFSFWGNYTHNPDVHTLGLDITYSYRAKVDIEMTYSGDVPNEVEVSGNYLIPGIKYFLLRQRSKYPVSIAAIGSYLFENYTYADELGKKVNVRSDGMIFGGGLYHSLKFTRPMRVIVFAEYLHPNITVKNTSREDLEFNRYHSDFIRIGFDVGFPYRNRRLFTAGFNVSRNEDSAYFSIKIGMLFGSFM